MIEGQSDGKFAQNVKLGHSCSRVMKGKLSESRVEDHVGDLGSNVSSSAHNFGCMVNGGNAIYGSNLSIIIIIIIMFLQALHM